LPTAYTPRILKRETRERPKRETRERGTDVHGLISTALWKTAPLRVIPWVEWETIGAVSGFLKPLHAW
jgi:hypothetical protein